MQDNSSDRYHLSRDKQQESIDCELKFPEYFREWKGSMWRIRLVENRMKCLKYRCMLDRGQDIEINLINMWHSRLLSQQEFISDVGIGDKKVSFWDLQVDNPLNLSLQDKLFEGQVNKDLGVIGQRKNVKSQQLRNYVLWLSLLKNEQLFEDEIKMKQNRRYLYGADGILYNNVVLTISQRDKEGLRKSNRLQKCLLLPRIYRLMCILKNQNKFESEMKILKGNNLSGADMAWYKIKYCQVHSIPAQKQNQSAIHQFINIQKYLKIHRKSSQSQPEDFQDQSSSSEPRRVKHSKFNNSHQYELASPSLHRHNSTQVHAQFNKNLSLFKNSKNKEQNYMAGLDGINMLIRMYERLQQGNYCPNGGVQCQKDIDLGQLTLRYYLYEGDEQRYLRYLQKYVQVLQQVKHNVKGYKFYNFYLSRLQELQCDYDLSIISMKKCLEMIGDTNYKQKGIVYHEIGRLYFEIKRNKQSLYYFRKSYEQKQLDYTCLSILDTLYCIIYLLILWPQLDQGDYGDRKRLYDYVLDLGEIKRGISGQGELRKWINSLHIRSSYCFVCEVQGLLKDIYYDPWRQIQSKQIGIRIQKMCVIPKFCKSYVIQKYLLKKVGLGNIDQRKDEESMNDTQICEQIKKCELSYADEINLMNWFVHKISQIENDIGLLTEQVGYEKVNQVQVLIGEMQNALKLNLQQSSKLKIRVLIINLELRVCELKNEHMLLAMLQQSIKSLKQILKQIECLKSVCVNFSMDIREMIYAFYKVYQKEISIQDWRWILQQYYNNKYYNNFRQQLQIRGKMQIKNSQGFDKGMMRGEDEGKIIQYCCLMLKCNKDYVNVVNVLQNVVENRLSRYLKCLCLFFLERVIEYVPILESFILQTFCKDVVSGQWFLQLEACFGGCLIDKKICYQSLRDMLLWGYYCLGRFEDFVRVICDKVMDGQWIWHQQWMWPQGAEMIVKVSKMDVLVQVYYKESQKVKELDKYRGLMQMLMRISRMNGENMDYPQMNIKGNLKLLRVFVYNFMQGIGEGRDVDVCVGQIEMVRIINYILQSIRQNIGSKFHQQSIEILMTVFKDLDRGRSVYIVLEQALYQLIQKLFECWNQEKGGKEIQGGRDVERRIRQLCGYSVQFMKRIHADRNNIIDKCLQKWIPWIVGKLIKVKEGVSAKYEIEQIVGILVSWFIDVNPFASIICYLYLFKCGYPEPRLLLTAAQQQTQQFLLLRLLSMPVPSNSILTMPQILENIKLSCFLFPVLNDLIKIKDGYRDLILYQKECQQFLQKDGDMDRYIWMVQDLLRKIEGLRLIIGQVLPGQYCRCVCEIVQEMQDRVGEM